MLCKMVKLEGWLTDIKSTCDDDDEGGKQRNFARSLARQVYYRECKDTINESYNINKTTGLSKLCIVPLNKEMKR